MPPQVIFFDAAGTLIGLREPVGEVYARIAARFGVAADPDALKTAFRAAWKDLPAPEHDLPPEDDDRAWWRALVEKTFEMALGGPLPAEAAGTLFEALYRHFALPEAWTVFEDVLAALERLKPRCRLYILSNFDRRLRGILAGHGLAEYFDGMVISSEVGAAKPHPRIFQAALHLAGVAAADCMHVGDDEKADMEGAAGQGIAWYLVHRPGSGLMELAEKLFPE